MKLIKGNFIYSIDKDNIEVKENQYALIKDGKIEGFYSEIPENLENIEITDYKDNIIIPGLIDLHVHAPQYAFRGMGMDMQLLDWLNTYAFKEEGKYRDLEYAKKQYSKFVNDVKNSATTRLSIFATLHKEATIMLMDLLEEAGIKAYVGKVNMDRNAPEFLTEDTEKSKEDTIDWLEETKDRYENIKPILTPRFIPSCTNNLMTEINKINDKYNIPVQSHLSENPSEIEWVAELHPDTNNYAQAYDKYNLFGKENKTIMAHCVHCPDDELDLIKQNNVTIAHCPQSNANLTSGIAPIKKMLGMGIEVGLGSDIAAGSSLSIFRAMSDAVQVSKLREAMTGEANQILTLSEVFYLGTKGGGKFFGNVGSFGKGYEFDAVVLNDESFGDNSNFTLKERLERIIYLSDDRNIVAKYVAGKKII
ncbi:amidohydrolase family protein [Intestinibacter bartlettii]|uniref:Amidohydrolase family protein n=1 Tax=Intestinibacter bartlettii TaxID=261299 RepID=A0ABS6DX46_9FIRM|nr:amidohydrolase family protein [Intestinibacter bartlettii]MBU5336413.1 amidohydrolase family protein [Intestinibacter bartlettii]MDO5010587.1 amidohydrolase family protein [Intestinibacter bartlettii]